MDKKPPQCGGFCTRKTPPYLQRGDEQTLRLIMYRDDIDTMFGHISCSVPHRYALYAVNQIVLVFIPHYHDREVGIPRLLVFFSCGKLPQLFRFPWFNRNRAVFFRQPRGINGIILVSAAQALKKQTIQGSFRNFRTFAMAVIEQATYSLETG